MTRPDLPGVLREFERIVGLPATLRIVSIYGGVRLYVPRQMHAGHPLAVLIGVDAAQRLAEVYGGEEHFDIPRAVAIARASRNRARPPTATAATASASSPANTK